MKNPNFELDKDRGSELLLVAAVAAAVVVVCLQRTPKRNERGMIKDAFFSFLVVRDRHYSRGWPSDALCIPATWW